MTAERHVVCVERSWSWRPLRRRWRWHVTWNAAIGDGSSAIYSSASYSGFSGPSGHAVTRWGAQRRALKAVRSGSVEDKAERLLGTAALADLMRLMVKTAQKSLGGRPARQEFTYAVLVERDEERCSIESVDLLRKVA